MFLSPEKISALKENLQCRCEILQKLLDCEKDWPAPGELPVGLQAEQALADKLQFLVKNCSLPAATWKDSWDFVQPAERPKLEGDLKKSETLTNLFLERHQHRAEEFNRRFMELARGLQAVQQERKFLQALRQTRNQAGRVNLIG